MYSELTSSNFQWPSSEFDSTYAFSNDSFSPEAENEQNENASANGRHRTNADDNANEFNHEFDPGRETMCERKEITYATSRVSFQRPSVDGGKAADVNTPDVGQLREESEEEVVTENLYYEPPELWSEEDVIDTDK